MTLTTQVAAVRRFLRVAEDTLPQPAMAQVRAVADRTTQRLALSHKHTVVALAGATGSGKSSIFNAIAGSVLSDTGLRRPTTSVPHACVWGAEGSDDLLDWLGIPANRRFDRQGAPDDAAAARLQGLVLLDLPDFDSIKAEHRAEVDRILSMVDRVVWVLDPQKYADEVVHERYLRPTARHRGTTAVVLNQADTLAPAEMVRCLADLRRLLGEHGMAGVPVLASSTIAPHGLNQLRTMLERGVCAEDGPMARITVDLTTEIERLHGYVEVEATEDRADRATVGHLIDALSVAAGVPARIDAVESGYRAMATVRTGWPVTRWLRRLRGDPLRRLNLPAPGLPEITMPEVAAAQRATAALAARELATTLTSGLPAPWPAAAHAAARAREREIPQALEVAVRETDVTPARAPVWWRAVEALHWVAVCLALSGLAWLAARTLAGAFGAGPLPDPGTGPVRLSGWVAGTGLFLGLGMAAVSRPLVRLAARQARRRAELRLRVAVAEVASDLVVAPVRGVLRAYTDARAAMHPLR